jgi:hypothetical protein
MIARMSDWSSRRRLVLGLVAAVITVTIVIVAVSTDHAAPVQGFAARFQSCVAGRGAHVSTQQNSAALFTGITGRRIGHLKSVLLGDGSQPAWATEFADAGSTAQYVLVERTDLPVFNAKTGPEMTGVLHLVLAPARHATLLYGMKTRDVADCAADINDDFKH